MCRAKAAKCRGLPHCHIFGLENDGENESECLMLNELATDQAGDGLCANETEI